MQTLLRRAILCSFMLAALLPTDSARGQAMITGGRQTAFTPFGQATLLRPDWGPNSNFGYTIGADYTHFIRSRIEPSFEVRASTANGTTVNEHTYLGGIQLQTPFHGIYPYVTFLGGYGGIHYNYYLGGFTGDHSLIYSLGGGADIPVASHLRLRLDFTRQFWNVAPQTINPMTISAGFAYTFGGSRGIVR